MITATTCVFYRLVYIRVPKTTEFYKHMQMLQAKTKGGIV